jgi:glycerate kinase
MTASTGIRDTSGRRLPNTTPRPPGSRRRREPERSGHMCGITGRGLRVLIAPDSFKGSLSAAEVTVELAAGWRAQRPQDELILLPQADGGEGTVDAIAAATPGSEWRSAGGVLGPDGHPTEGRWLMLPDGTAAIELAQMSGLPLMAEPDPLGATTVGLGQVIAAALDGGARSLVVGLGGSASTDGGAGALRALGARLLDEADQPIPNGGGGLARLHRVDLTALRPPPDCGVQILVDTRAVLLGAGGAAHLFGAQKGADADQRAALDAALARWAGLLGESSPVRPTVAVDTPGTGAAGGTGYGLAVWGGRFVAGAARVAELTGLAQRIPDADVVVTGEGRFDRTSLSGKLVGAVLDRCRRHDIRTVVVAGAFAAPSGALDVSLTELAGSSARAQEQAARWSRAAGEYAARRLFRG